jgi:S-adenosylmethionine:tRNA ribosyltransferase-isomerase
MHISDFDYELPEKLIAQEPLAKRDGSRMLVVDRSRQQWHDDEFLSLPEYLHAGDVLVLNNTRVFPARLKGRRHPSGGAVELFLVRETAPYVWECMARPGRRMGKGARIVFGEAELQAEVLGSCDNGLRVVKFESDQPWERIVDQIGMAPLPPYIKRERGSSQEDRDRYQTVYARERGAIAAPTAGLHFTDDVLQTIRDKDVRIVQITLHVGYGTFEPIRVDNVFLHRVASEWFSVSEPAAETINQARAGGNRVVSIGTTTARALEAAADPDHRIQPGSGLANLTIIPGYEFRAVDVMLTNFHLPCSSLLVLVSTFAGREFILAAYRHAVTKNYRFYGYGDCMLVL